MEAGKQNVFKNGSPVDFSEQTAERTLMEASCRSFGAKKQCPTIHSPKWHGGSVPRGIHRSNYLKKTHQYNPHTFLHVVPHNTNNLINLRCSRVWIKPGNIAERREKKRRQQKVVNDKGQILTKYDLYTYLPLCLDQLAIACTPTTPTCITVIYVLIPTS